MQIAPPGNNRRDNRYRYDGAKTARIRAGGQEIQATVSDISSSGIALNTAAYMATNDFVEMHVDGMGHVAGNVVRAYSGGVAVKFDLDEDAQRNVDKEIAHFNRVA